MRDLLTIRGMFYRNAPATYRIAAHQHEQWQWYVVLHGDVVYHIDGQELMLTNGDWILVAPGTIRSPESHDAAPGYIMSLFETELDLLPLANRKQRISPSLNPDLEALASELKNPVDGYAQDLIHVLLTRLILGIYREGSDQRRSPTYKLKLNTNSNMAVAHQAIAFMEANLFRQLNREDLAAAVHCSPPHFARVFKSAIGTTPGAYLTQLRLARAREFLRTSSLSISQIAIEVGFNSFSHFTQLFKREVGMSPSDYRKGH